MKWNLAIFILFGPALAAVAANVPNSLTYEGVITDSITGQPIDLSNNNGTFTSINFLVVSAGSSGTCVLYSETANFNSPNGVISQQIGTGSVNVGVAADLPKFFSSTTALTGTVGGTTCTVQPADPRVIQIQVPSKSIIANIPLSSVPYALVANDSRSVGGYDSSQVLRLANGVNTAGSELSAAAWTDLQNIIAGTSSKYISSTATLRSSSPPTSNTDLTNKTYVDSQITNFNVSNITQGVLPAANGGTGSNTSLSGGKVMISASAGGVGSIIEGFAYSPNPLPNTFTTRDGNGGIFAELGSFSGVSITSNSGIASMKFVSSSGGQVILAAPDVTTSVELTLPNSVGALGQFITSDGTGVLRWSDSISVAQGSATNPGYSFTPNKNTGLFMGTNFLGFSVLGSERLRIDSTGHIAVTAASTPTLSCTPSNTGSGSSTITASLGPSSNDTRGFASFAGSTSATTQSCILTFANPFSGATPPFCVVSWSSSTAPSAQISAKSDTTALTVVFSSPVDTAQFTYHCLQ